MRFLEILALAAATTTASILPRNNSTRGWNNNTNVIVERFGCDYNGEFSADCYSTGCDGNAYCQLPCCITCAPGTQFIQGSGGIGSTCTVPFSGAEYDCGRCDLCGPGTFSNDGGDCQDCPAGLLSTPDGSGCRDPCPTGATYEYARGQCVCPTGQAIDGSACSDCAAGESSDGLTCTDCDVNQFSVAGGSCQACPDTSTSQAGSATCQCPSPMSLDTGRALCVCAVGDYIDNGGCSNCSPGQSSDGVTCFDCGANTFAFGGGGVCKVCPAESTSGTRSDACICPDGSLTIGSACPPPCPTGATYDTTLQVCLCPTGQAAQNGGCADCPAGQTSQGVNCFSCNSDTFSLAGSTCQSCPTTSSADPGSASCVCPDGSITTGTACPPCTLDAGGNCICLPGHRWSISLHRCVRCPAGTYGMNGITCPLCSPGHFSNAGSAFCTTCPSDTIAPDYGTAFTCAACDPGLTNDQAHTQCVPMPSGGMRRRTSRQCSRGFTACPVASGYECIDILVNLQSCGGCWSTGQGIDCTAFDDLADATCMNGRCQCGSVEWFELTADTCPPDYKLTSQGCLLVEA